MSYLDDIQIVDVDVIILTYDGLALVTDCLQSLSKQSVRPRNVFVVDNGSSDGTGEFIRQNFSHIHLIRLDQNVGLPKAFNKALTYCTSKYVCWLNNDIVLETDWLRKMYNAIRRDDNIASCDSTVMYYDDRERVWSQGAEYTCFGSARFRNQGKAIENSSSNVATKIVATVGCAALYRRKVFSEIGALDETYFLGFEDVDWAVRAVLAGYKHFNVPNAIIYHKVSQTVRIGSKQYVRNGQRNVTATFIKNTPSTLLLIFMFPHIFYQVSAFLYYFLNGRGLSWLLAKKDNVLLLPYYLQQRKIIQNSRKISTSSYLRLLNFSLRTDKLNWRRRN